MLKKENGVTLVALVITIIVLLILATVTLAMVMGPSGIFQKANDASDQTAIANMSEAVNRACMEQQVSLYTEENNYNGKATLADLETPPAGESKTIFEQIMETYGYEKATTLSAKHYTITIDTSKATVEVQQDKDNKAKFEITVQNDSFAVTQVTE